MRLIAAILIAALCVASTPAAAQDTGPRALLPDSMRWAQIPTLLPGGEVTVLAGRMSEAGPYAFRVRFPPGFRVMPHTHPDDRVYTVISGTWFIGIGEQFDSTGVTGYPAGTVYLLPAGTPHYHLARDGASTAQVNAVGPTATDYVRQEDDPRKR